MANRIHTNGQYGRALAFHIVRAHGAIAADALQVGYQNYWWYGTNFADTVPKHPALMHVLDVYRGSQ